MWATKATNYLLLPYGKTVQSYIIYVNLNFC